MSCGFDPGKPQRRSLLWSGKWANCTDCIIVQEVEPPLNSTGTEDSLNRHMLYGKPSSRYSSPKKESTVTIYYYSITLQHPVFPFNYVTVAWKMQSIHYFTLSDSKIYIFLFSLSEILKPKSSYCVWQHHFIHFVHCFRHICAKFILIYFISLEALGYPLDLNIKLSLLYGCSGSQCTQTHIAEAVSLSAVDYGDTSSALQPQYLSLWWKLKF